MAQSNVADILLIGSGGAGGPFAWYLSQVKDITIVCLEQGDWEGNQRPEESLSSVGRWEGGTLSGWGADDPQWKRLIQAPRQPGAVYFPNGYPYDRTESYWEPILGFHVGGASVHWAGGWGRFRPSDFLQRTLTGYGADWPFPYEELARWYDYNDALVGISGEPHTLPNGEPAYPYRRYNLLPPARSARAGSSKTLFESAADQLGWRYVRGGERAVISVPFKGRDPRNFRQAKLRADVVHWPDAIENGVVLKPRSTVREITVDPQGRVDGALYYDAAGMLHEQKARIVVVACNAIGTARLLLNSTSTQFPDGLANRSGLVGKGLMGHPGFRISAEFENDDPSRSFGGGGVSIDEFRDPALRGGAIGGFSLRAGGLTGPVAIALGTPPVSLDAMIPADLEGGPRFTPTLVAWGRRHHAAFQQRYKRTASISISSTEEPEDDNRVELHPTLTDDFGTPAPKLIYKRSENTLKLHAYAAERAKDLAEAAGATRVLLPDDKRDWAGRGAAPGHYMGTARMGTDPSRSVVDQWGHAHDVKNLFIIDGSTFATAGTGGMMPTTQANALRIADYFKTNVRRLLTM